MSLASDPEEQVRAKHIKIDHVSALIQSNVDYHDQISEGWPKEQLGNPPAGVIADIHGFPAVTPGPIRVPDDEPENGSSASRFIAKTSLLRLRHSRLRWALRPR